MHPGQVASSGIIPRVSAPHQGWFSQVHNNVEHPEALSLPGFVRFAVRQARVAFNGPDTSFKPGDRRVPEVPLNGSVLTPMRWFRRSPLAALNWVNENVGPVATFRGLNDRLHYVVSETGVLRKVLKDTDHGADPLDKSALLGVGAGFVIGNDTVLVVSNQAWHVQHKLVGPELARGRFDDPRIIGGVRSSVAAGLEDLARRIKDAPGHVLKTDLQKETSLLTLRVALHSLYGRGNYSYRELAEIRDASRIVHAAFPMETLFPFKIPRETLSYVSPFCAQLVAAKKFLVAFAEKILSEEIASPSSPPNIATGLARACTTSTPLITRDAALHNILALLFAGHESSGNLFAYGLGQAAQNPAYADNLVRESQQYAPGVDSLKAMVESHPFTYQFLEEVLRMHPPVYLLLRTVAKPYEVMTDQGRINFPVGAEILLNVFAAQREEKQWGTAKTGYPADTFRPQRWTDENKARFNLGRSDLDLSSFGGGTRVCSGMHLTRSEAAPIIGGFLSLVHIHPLYQDIDGGMVSDFTLQKKGGHPVLLTLRR